MEHLISITLDQRAGEVFRTIIKFIHVCSLKILYREVKVFLHCDESASSPMATTDGDSGEILHYVHKLIV